MIKWPVEGTIDFFAEADNGLRLFFDDEAVINGWGQQEVREGSWNSEKGRMIPFRIEYFQDGGSAHLRLFWSWKGRQRELIPAENFFHTPAQRNSIDKIVKDMQGALDSYPRPDNSAIYQAKTPDTLSWRKPEKPIPASPGPHVLVSDYLIDKVQNVKRRVIQPIRNVTIPNPLITSDSDRCFQPFFSVLPFYERSGFRIWYGAWRDDTSHSRSHLAYLTSEDGIHFNRPMVICNTPEIQFGSEVIDRGPAWEDPAQRYLYIYWLKGGSRLLVSADGLNWTPMSDTTVISHNHDITGIWWDSIRKHYVATISTFMRSDRWIGRRRTTMQCYSTDLITWTDPAFVLYANPGQGDQGETQFYGMSGYLVRGSLIIAMVKVLRDDLIAEDVASDAFGRAHTSLAWSYDGEHWMRDLDIYFEPDPDPAAWDHAHAWIDEQLIIGDSTRLYYGGYRQGHKKNRFRERQIGLVRILRDRYVAWENDTEQTGELQTVSMIMNIIPEAFELNADAGNGQIRVAISDAITGRNIEGLGYAECVPVTSDDLQAKVYWGNEETTKQRLTSLKGRIIHLSFQLSHARLFAFEFK